LAPGTHPAPWASIEDRTLARRSAPEAPTAPWPVSRPVKHDV